MSVNKELLEKYHLGLCTPQEQRIVEKWLLDDTLDAELELTDTHKISAQREIWEVLAPHIENQPAITSKRLAVIRKTAAYATGIAASIALMWLVWPMADTPSEQVFDNTANFSPLWFKQSDYDILLGEASRATIDIQNGKLEVEGNLLFKPKQDINIHSNRGNMLLKRGEVYIILEEDHTESQFIFSKNEVTFLPPAVQRKLKQQFDIS